MIKIIQPNRLDDMTFPHLLTNSGVIGLVVVVLFTGLVLGCFYDRFWLPHDDSAYAHVAHACSRVKS